MIDIDKVPSPCYVMDEKLLRKNLSLIKSVADKAGVEIILAFKSFAMWKSFPIFREYIRYTTASSVYEARLAYEEFGSKAHTYSPAYTETDFPVIMKCSSHITFNSFINKNKAGDWGDDIPKDGTIKVGCVRGADIIKLNDVPTRYITSKHSDRLLEDGDIVIEVSGGSPIQATGRVALITNGVIERNGGALVCSNFCQSFSMKKRVFSEYFYYLWKNLYDNDNMFNFEGKTSGIKNFQTEVFLANHWFEVPKQLIETFHAVVSQYHLMIDKNIAESNNLIKQRDELLPLLMNGQVSVNSDLSHD